MKRASLKDWHAIILLGVAVALFFREILLQRAFFWEDWLTQVYPFRTFAAVSLAGGELPLWNPFAYSGMPFQADIQSAVFYLPNLLLTLFVRDGSLSMYWIELFVVAHYWLAGVTMYFLAREFRQEPVYALFSGLVFSLSGFMIVRVIHPAFVEQLAWLPLIVLLLNRAIVRRSIPHAILGGLVLGHSILAGAPQISLYIFFFLGLFALFVVFSDTAERGWMTKALQLRFAVLLVIVAVGLAAIQLLPTLELVPLSQRAELALEQAQSYQLAWTQLITGIIPKFFGASNAEGSTFWGPGTYQLYWETCFYFGIAALLMVALSTTVARRNKYVLFFLGIVVLSLLLALGDHFILYRIFFAIVPGFATFRAVVRIMALATFAAAILSGFGLRAMIELIAERPRIAERYLLGASAVVSGLWLLVQVGVFLPGSSNLDYDNIRDTATQAAHVALGFTLVVCGIGFLLARGVIRPVLALPALLLVQFGDVSVFGFEQNNGAYSADDYYREARQIVPAIKEVGKHELFRVTSRRDQLLLLDRNQGMVDRIYLTEGYTPLALKRILPPARDWDASYDLLNSKFRIAVNEQARQIYFATALEYMPRAFVVRDMKVIADENSISAFMRSAEFDPRRTVVIEENPAIAPEQDSSTTPSSTVIESYGQNSIALKVDTRRNGILVLSEIFYPGWNAYVDGKRQPVMRANWSLRAVPLSAGSHSVEMRFEPASFRMGAIVSGGTLLLSCVMLALFRVRRAIEGSNIPL